MATDPARFTDDFTGEVYDDGGNLIVGSGYTIYTPEQRRTLTARNIATNVATETGDDALAIALEIFPEPENEGDRYPRIFRAAAQALRLAQDGFPEIAIEMGVLPKPRVEYEPRQVSVNGRQVKKAVERQF